jgi:hypothetical protein
VAGGLFCKRKVDVTTLVVHDDKRGFSEYMVIPRNIELAKLHDIGTRTKGIRYLDGTEFWQHFKRRLGIAYINRGV